MRLPNSRCASPLDVAWHWRLGSLGYGFRYSINRIPSGIQQKMLFSDHLVAIPSGYPLDLATSIGFSDLDPRDGGWSQNPM